MAPVVVGEGVVVALGPGVAPPVAGGGSVGAVSWVPSTGEDTGGVVGCGGVVGAGCAGCVGCAGVVTGA